MSHRKSGGRLNQLGGNALTITRQLICTWAIASASTTNTRDTFANELISALIERHCFMDSKIASSLTLAERFAAVTRRGLDLTPVLTTVTTHAVAEHTKAVAHCHHVALDGSCLPRLSDFTDEVANWLLDYVTPRRLLMAASSSNQQEARLKNERLRRQAIDTFKRYGMSGEQGEMLLFVLAESLLKYRSSSAKWTSKRIGRCILMALMVSIADQ
ncbi:MULTISPECIES: Hachiman antiphage defense system protein HamA [unclassified Bradyrhizobium]|uniref:Hachiman antiphage defense system protein HamA n=1 Tax=unclassified Bradyrhizobium TaxID=2631580 RepID=UPI00155DFCA0|nr:MULTISPECIES: Hachiman antiphage defense system protein HamA [Bradyrhizobium]UUO32216.1 DUF1837 domain-containing protein [Bradyrhizobium sp. WBAH42]